MNVCIPVDRCAGFFGFGQHAPRVIIKPITIRLIAYGQPANLAAIRTRAVDLLKEEHGKVDPALLVAMSAIDVHAEILATRFDVDVVLKKPTAKKPGLAITLPEMNERTTVEWLHELPLAKTCVMFVTWISPREGMSWQLLAIDGSRWSESRPLQA